MKGFRAVVGWMLVVAFVFGIGWYAVESIVADAAASWYSPSWQYRREIVVDHTKVRGTSNLANFPVLVTASAPELRSTGNGGHVEKADGSDIVFTASDGTTVLPFEIESYSPSSGAVTAWVKVTALSPTADSSVFMYYGNASASSLENRSAVWDANFRGVWHLKENPGTAGTGGILDSSTAGVSATDNGSMTAAGQVSGKIGNGIALDGIDDHLSSGFPSSFNAAAGTLTFWFRPNFNGNDGQKYIILDTSGNFGFWVAKNSDNYVWFFFNNGPAKVAWAKVPASSIAAGTWHELSVRWSISSRLENGHFVDIMLNGSSAGAVYGDDPGTGTLGAPGLVWGKQGGSINNGEIGTARYWNGALDEIRLSNAIRSADWVSTEYNNQSNPSSFAVTRTEESQTPTVDTEAPAVAVTSPLGGSTVAGSISLAASASDNVGVVGVQFKVDGANVGAEDVSAPYSVSWNSANVGDGSHTITAVARDAAGNVTASGGAQVNVANADTVAPAVSFTAPIAGSAVSGSVALSATASDNVGVVGVQFKADGINIGTEDLTAPYGTSWNSTAVSDGSRSLQAIARDAAGNRSTSTIAVTVDNVPEPDTVAPAVSITSPANNSTASGTVQVAASASDNVGVVGVQFKVDGANLGAEDLAAPYSVSWNSAAAADGEYTLTAVARDTAGNSTASNAVRVTIDNVPPADTVAPTVAISSPAPGSTVSGIGTISAIASDNVGVAGVTFFLDSAQYGTEDVAPPYSIAFDSIVLGNGQRSVYAVARDGAGNYATSTAANFTVLNDSVPPVISGVGASMIGATGATVAWTTDEAATGRVDYGTTAAYGMSTTTAARTTAHSFALSGLVPDTVYHFRVASSDANGNQSASADQTFRTAAPAPGGPWYSSAWKYRREIAVPAGKVTSSLSNFPIAVTLTDPAMKGAASGGHVALATGADIVFTSGNGTTLVPFEIESYNPSTGALVAWVKPALISPTSETKLYMYYGNAGATSQQSAADVWEAAYRTVLHLKEDPAVAGTGGIKDSSAAAAHATDNGSMNAADLVQGKIGTGFDLDGVNDYLSETVPASFTGSTGAISFWFKSGFNGNDGMKYVLLDHNGNYPLWIAKNSNNNLWFFFNNGPGRVLSAQVPASGIVAGTWNHVSVRWNIATRLENGHYVDLKLNGSSAGGTFNDNPGTKTLPRSSLYWGRQGSSSGNGEIGTAKYMFGVIDELRISNVVRTPEWAAAEFASQGDPGFVAFGAESTEGATEPPPTDTVSPTVTVSAPAANATVSGTVAISATASDNVGVAGVQFKIDGANLGAEDTVPPYSIVWNSSGVADGGHAITAVARDAAGNSAMSVATSVIVDNVPSTATVTIMPFGDSITSGSTSHDSYRRPLWQRLQAAGYNVDFVGDFTDNTGGPAPHQDFDLNHQSVSGIRADQQLPFTTEANRHRPERVLMYIGYNDLYNNQSVSSTLSEMGQLVDAMRAANPNVYVFVAKPYVWGDATMEARLNEFIAAIPGWASSKSTAQSPVIVVDHTNVNASTDTYDGLHPNDQGDQKLSDNWYNALIQTL